MVNVILDAKNQAFKLCTVDGIDVVSRTQSNSSPKKLNYIKISNFQHSYHSRMDTLIDGCITSMTSGLCSRLTAVLEAVLTKLARFDEGSLIGSILTIAVKFL